MVQFAVNDEEEQKFWRIFERLSQQTFSDLEAYFQNAYKSKELGRVIYEEQLMPIYKTLEKSLFIKAFSEIVEGQKTLGSINAYLRILYAIFGGDAQIEVTQQPMHLKVDIIAPIRVHYIWVKKDKKQIITKDGKAIVFKDLLAEVTDRELLQILKSTTKAGTYIEFTLNRTEE
jgi:hypothetical protein